MSNDFKPKEFIVSVSEYAIYYATIPHERGGRPKNPDGSHRCVRQRIYDGRPLPDTIWNQMIGKRHFIYVSEGIYRTIKRLVRKKEKEKMN